jgi:hypothetical protein
MRTHLNEETDTEYLCFRSFSKNEKTDNVQLNAGNQKLRKRFCEDAVNVICVDASFSGKINHPEGKRLLLATPYDYQFKNYCLSEKRSLQLNTLKKFSHIIAGSPFTEQLLKEAYKLEAAEIIGQTALPLAWEVCQTDKQRIMMDKIAFYYPEIRHKKVMTFLCAGNDGEEAGFFGNMDMKEFFAQLDKDWFVFTNSRSMMENAYVLSSDYRKSFAYINHLLQPHELLFVTDVLITNNGRMAASFSGRNKPVYCPLYKGSYFEKYMKKQYKNLCIESSDRLFSYPLTEMECNHDQKQFCRDFYYENAENPYQKTAELMGLVRETK